MSTFVSFLWKVQLYDFSFANEVAQQNDPVQKKRERMLALVVRAGVSFTRGKLHTLLARNFIRETRTRSYDRCYTFQECKCNW